MRIAKRNEKTYCRIPVQWRLRASVRWGFFRWSKGHKMNTAGRFGSFKLRVHFPGTSHLNTKADKVMYKTTGSNWMLAVMITLAHLFTHTHTCWRTAQLNIANIIEHKTDKQTDKKKSVKKKKTLFSIRYSNHYKLALFDQMSIENTFIFISTYSLLTNKHCQECHD